MFFLAMLAPIVVLAQVRESGEPELAALVAAVKASDTRGQRLAAISIGRLENPAHRDILEPLVHSPDAAVRLAAAAALAQMRVPFAYGGWLEAERANAVRAVIYEAIGRATPVADDAEGLLVAGLSEADLKVRTGAARGLESLFRLNNAKPPRRLSAATTSALHTAFGAHKAEEFRILILLAMNAVGDRDAATFSSALADASPQVRRLAVIGTGTWVGDPSPMVRYEALRVSKSCERAAAGLEDADEHVKLAAIDQVGTLKCDAALVVPLVASDRPWRVRAHALVALATVDPATAGPAVRNTASDKRWQARVYAARAAHLLNDSVTLATLARDANPNVAIAALSTPDDAMRALRSNHSGLILAGAGKLKGVKDLNARLPQLVAAFNRQTATGSMTVRDERVALLTRIGEVNDASTGALMRKALADRDPVIAALAAQILTTRSGGPVTPLTTRLPVSTAQPDAYIEGLLGARLRISMVGGGFMTLDLLTEDAPVTVAVLAQLVEAGKYNGLTFHRIVPNFVVQGGSPGADEFDGRTRQFMRDEVGLARNARGSMGISTRGRDTGDGQFYFNLVDNVRLDHDYTVFATMRTGLDVMDRVQEGDVMERVEIVRRRR